MTELTGRWARWPKAAAIAAPLLLGAAALALERTLGSVAALSLLAAAGAVLLVAVLTVGRRSLRRARDWSRLTEQALDSMPQAVFIADANGGEPRNLYVNPAYSALTGYAVPEAVAERFDARAIFDRGDSAPLDSGAELPARGRVTIRHRDGPGLRASLDVRTIVAGNGRRYVVGHIEAVKGAEGPAPDPRNQGVGPEAAPARGSERAKDAFLSWLAHELRSPLNACGMWLDVLALAPSHDKLAKAVDAIKRNLARQARLVSDLSHAAKISSGALEFRTEPVELVELVARELESWQVLASGRQVTFARQVEIDEATVEGDPERLREALNHLLENAISSTPAGGRVELRVHRTDGACVIEVEDTGAPLSAEDAEKLSAPLERPPGAARTRSGLGLGLAVAHHIAVRHGGSLSAAAGAGATGARFVVQLPLRPGSPPPSAERAH